MQEKKADTWLREAEACQQQALKLASTETEFADTSLQARALKGLGVCLHARCEYETAFQLHRSATYLAPTAELPWLTSCALQGVHFNCLSA